MDLQVRDLRTHRVRVDLAHVRALVRLLHALDVQVPDLVVVPAHRHAGVVRDDLVVDRLDGLVVRPDPRDLYFRNNVNTIEVR